MGKKKGAVPPQSASEDAALASDVAAFASQLGLAGAGGGEFDDFRPERAQQRLGEAPAEPRKRSTNKFKPVEEAPEEPAPQWQPALDPELEAAIKERTWNEGVGERPGAVWGRPAPPLRRPAEA